MKTQKEGSLKTEHSKRSDERTLAARKLVSLSLNMISGKPIIAISVSVYPVVPQSGVLKHVFWRTHLKAARTDKHIRNSTYKIN